jgi:hypothetical protein
MQGDRAVNQQRDTHIPGRRQRFPAIASVAILVPQLALSIEGYT